ncbi:hypothetical protein BDP27DRAFT_1319320 [Rhodocollybia butyracea]|uniref:Uncharacterized protein n=1 Tax=Rhodocollybia butyracea TaxID=206335 RepID=A0A9P5Q1H9_9AGAR|nr:hypothetical protein BDP27DRAFT_1319320 [Rhodocollybia butyracea]
MNSNRRNISLPQERQSFSDQMSSIGARINRAFSRGRSAERLSRDFDNESLASSTATVVSTQDNIGERSVSRGREGLRRSSGRGGLGNIITPTVPENSTVDHSTSLVRGRDTRPSTTVSAGTSFSTGRGGAGNIRPTSQEESDAITLVSSRSSDVPRSPSQTSPSRNVLSTGRGGIGNIKRNPTGDSNNKATPTEGGDQEQNGRV